MAKKIYIGAKEKLEVVDYIESTGTQYIDTGIVATPNTRLVCNVRYSSTTSYQSMGYSNDDNVCLLFGIRDNGYFEMYAGNGWTTKVKAGTSNTNRHIFDVKSGSQKLDDTTYGTSTFTNTAAGTLYLFAIHYNGKVNEYSKAQIYSCKIYNGSELVRDLVPVKTTDNTYCMYDKITQTKFLNQGTGEFIGGYLNTELEYIEANSVQYIDTGIKNSANIRVVSCMAFPSGETFYNGTEVGGTNGRFKWGHNGGNQLGIGWGSNFYNYAVDTSKDSVANYHIFDLKQGSQIIKSEDGTELAKYTNTTLTKYATKNIYLFKLWIEASSNTWETQNGSARMKYCKIYNGDTLIRDFVPFIDSNGVRCLYDKVNKTYYYNQGTGIFLGKDNIEASEIITLKDKARKVKKIYVGKHEQLKVLDYMESTGSQYIDTGISITSALSFECEWEKTATGAGLNGSYYYINSTTKAFCFGLYSNEKLYVGVGSTTDTTVTGSLNTKYKTIGNSTSMTTYQNDVSKVSVTSTLVENGLNFYLFATHRNQGNIETGYYGQYKIYSCKLYENNILVRDFVPALDKNGIACLYDKVNNKKYYNQGTGEFISGTETGEIIKNNNKAKKVKKGYIGVKETLYPVEYIESNTIQQILLDYCANQNTKIETQVMFNNLNTTENIWCSRTTNSSNTGTLSCTLFKLNTNNFRIDYGTAEQTVTDLTIEKDVIYTICMDKNKFYVNNNLIFTHTEEEYQSPNPIALLASYTTNTTTNLSNYSQLKMYYFKIYENDILIKNLIPVRNNKGIYGLYDTLNNKVFYSTPLAPLTGGEIIDSQNSYIFNKSKQFYKLDKELTFLGPTSRRAVSRGQQALASIGNYVLFAGGQLTGGNSVALDSVDAYDENLLTLTPTSLSLARYWFSGSNNDNYAIFAGGYNSSGRTGVVDAYNKSLTRTTATSLSVARSTAGAGSNGSYVLIAGGDASGNVVDAYSNTLVRSTPTTLSESRKELWGCRFNQYACFLGGYNTTAVDFYNSSLTRSNPTKLTNITRGGCVEANNNYVFRCGGGSGTSGNATVYVEAYDSNLVKYTPEQLTEPRNGGSFLNFGDYLVVTGGGDTSSFAEIYDTNLVHSIFPAATGKGYRGVVMGKYGFISVNWSNLTTVFKYE